MVTSGGSSRIAQEVGAWGAGMLRKRWFVRAPIGLYRARLGFLFGHRLLMLEHVGRTSGLSRRVVLEVIARPTADSYVVASGFGTEAQWFRNVQSNPDVRLWISSHRPASATARLLTPAEASEALAAYADAHPKAWNVLKPVVESALGVSISESGTELPLVRFDLTAERRSSNSAAGRVVGWDRK